MKTQLLATTLKPWKFKSKEGQDLEGFSLHFMLDDYSYHTVTVKNEILTLIQSTKLPALFEAEANPILKRNNETGKSSLKYEISNLKFLKDKPLF